MQILLLGKNGQLGREFQRTLAPLGSVIALGSLELNLQDFGAVRKTIQELRPQLIVNASAYTAVDRAESEAEKAYAINETIPGILAEEALALKAALIHYSTDYVFDGQTGIPYKEEDTPKPLNVYGKSKLAGEHAIQAVGGTYLIFRTSWVYSLGRDSFVTKVFEWSRQQKTMRVVNDQVSNPTWSCVLAEITTQVLSRGTGYVRDHSGFYHLAGGGFASRFEWARTILELDPNRHEQVVREILPALTADFPTAAQRPLFSALNCEKFVNTFKLGLPGWQEALRLAMHA
jgi:dTDP-4-dehydrorhamnose reductase